MKTYNTFLYEKFGSTKLVEIISMNIFNLLNNNIGKIILNKQYTFINEIDEIEINLKKEIGEDRVINLKFPNSKINVYLSDKTYGNINTNIIVDKDKIENIELNLYLTLKKPEIIEKKIFEYNPIQGTISHELLHIVELFFSNHNESKSWNLNKVLRNLQDKYKNNIEWDNISYFIYLTLEHELRARVQELSSEINNLPIKNNILTIIRNSKIYKDMYFLSNINEKILLKKLKKDKDFNNIIKDFNNDFLQKDNKYETNFKNYIKSIKKKAKKYLKKLEHINFQYENFNIDGKFMNKKINYKDYE